MKLVYNDHRCLLHPTNPEDEESMQKEVGMR